MNPPWHKTQTYAPRLWWYDFSVAMYCVSASEPPITSEVHEAVAVVRTEELVNHRTGNAGGARVSFEVLRDGGTVSEHASAAERARLVTPDVRLRTHVLSARIGFRISISIPGPVVPQGTLTAS